MTATVITLYDRAALSAIVPQWEELAANALEPNPFYEPWILLPALRARREGELCCASVWDGGRLIGLFPFERRREFKRLPVATLSSWRHSAYLLCTPLLRRDSVGPALRALLRWAVDEASVLEFLYVPAEGPFDDALRECARTLVRTARFTRPLLVKGASADAYMEEALSARLRRQLRRNQRRLAERGASTFAIGPGGVIGDQVERFIELEASSIANRIFGREVLKAAHRRGRLQLVGIDCEGRAIARRCSLLAGEGAYAFKTAYDEDYAAYSPGVLAEALSLCEFHALPRVKWMDSHTEPGDSTLNRMWRHRRSMQSIAVATGGWGALWLSVYSSLRPVVKDTARIAERARPSA